LPKQRRVKKTPASSSGYIEANSQPFEHQQTYVARQPKNRESADRDTFGCAPRNHNEFYLSYTIITIPFSLGMS
jgi:hypothetical protein